MALGAFTVANKGGRGSSPVYADLITLDGDGAYPAGGSPGFAALFAAAIGAGRTILGVIGQSQPDTLSELEYDHTDDKLLARVRTTGVESAVANQSAVTYRVLVFSK